MENLLGEMLGVFRSQTEIYLELKMLAEKKQERLLAKDISGLEKVVMAEEMLIVKAGRIEEKRTGLAAELANRLSLPVEDMTLEAMGRTIGDPAFGPLKEAAQGLIAVLEDISQLNILNREIIETSLAYVNFSLDLLTGRDRGSDGYGEEGQCLRGNNRLPLLDRRL